MKDTKLRESYREMNCLACGIVPSEACHIISFAVERRDESRNIIPLCHEHHLLQHLKGWYYMLAEYPKLLEDFGRRGYYLENSFDNFKVRRVNNWTYIK